MCLGPVHAAPLPCWVATPHLGPFAALRGAFLALLCVVFPALHLLLALSFDAGGWLLQGSAG